MSAYFDCGFSVREPAWHGLATVLDDYPGREDAIRYAGHDFWINETPVRFDYVDGTRTCDGWKVLLKDQTDQALGVVRSTYEVVQNEVIWDIADALMNQPNVKYETAGVLKGGAVLWVLCRSDQPSRVPGDDTDIYPYVMVSTAHDGSGSLKATATSIRTICWNTYSAADALGKEGMSQYTFRHSKKVMERIEDAKRVMAGTGLAHKLFMDMAIEMAKIQVNADQLREFAHQFIPEPAESVCTERVRNNIAKARIKWFDVLDGPTIPDAHKRTGYGLLQASVEYLDHVRPARNPETYFNRSLMRPERLKSHLADMVQAVCAA